MFDFDFLCFWPFVVGQNSFFVYSIAEFSSTASEITQMLGVFPVYHNVQALLVLVGQMLESDGRMLAKGCGCMPS